MKILDFNKSFSSEEDCEKYLKELREKEGLFGERNAAPVGAQKIPARLGR